MGHASYKGKGKSAIASRVGNVFKYVRECGANIPYQNNRIKGLIKSLKRNVKGENPWFPHRRVFRENSKDLKPRQLKYIRSLVKGHLVITGCKIGQRVKGSIKLMFRLSDRELRHFVSRLPLLASSLSYRLISRCYQLLKRIGFAKVARSQSGSRTGKVRVPLFK